MKVGIGNDHAAVELKNEIKAYLEEHFPEIKTVISVSHRDAIQYYL